MFLCAPVRQSYGAKMSTADGMKSSAWFRGTCRGTTRQRSCVHEYSPSRSSSSVKTEKKQLALLAVRQWQRCSKMATCSIRTRVRLEFRFFRCSDSPLEDSDLHGKCGAGTREDLRVTSRVLDLHNFIRFSSTRTS
jgi:hypothetical protein